MSVNAARTAGRTVLASAALLVAALSVFQLERAGAGLHIETQRLGATPITRYRAADTDEAPLVVIAHGYAGSRQLMQSLSFALARAGFDVLAFDFIGHGRHARAMSPDITRIEGTTAQLVAQTRRVLAAARALTGSTGPAALVGHSMATDILIRTAQGLPEIAAIVAISMYSDIVTADYPDELLIITGAWEPGLRSVALDALRQLDQGAREGQTVVAKGAVEGSRRRAVVAPRVEHLGVLFSPVTLAETRAWIAAATGRDAAGPVPARGPWILALLFALVLLYRPLAAQLAGGRRLETVTSDALPGTRLSTTRFLLALSAPVLPALAAAAALRVPVFGLAGFGALTAFLGAWGVAQLAVLACCGVRPRPPALPGLALLLVWGLAVFAPALDRYGAAFLPVGPRLPLLAVLALGAVPYTLADALLTAGAPLWRRCLVRLVPLAALAGAMFAAPASLGLAFTAAPVMLLFWLVYGVMGRWTARYGDASTAGSGLGLILAWSLAASTPLFSAA